MESRHRNGKKPVAVKTNVPDVAVMDGFLREVILSSGKSDPSEFLRTAERVLGRVCTADMAARLSARLNGSLAEMKERVYNIRYGGYSIGAEEMKEMSLRLRGLLKELREELF